jgi:hypothetical protein
MLEVVEGSMLGQTHMAELYEKVTENWLNFWGIPYSLIGFLSGFVVICVCPGSMHNVVLFQT